MAGITEKTSIKINVIENALNSAMFTLLRQLNFNKITVNCICSEALVSRATFYAHYTDKYDMLRYWLLKLQSYVIKRDESYEQIEAVAGRFVRENECIVNNLLNGASNETLEILSSYILSVLDVIEENIPQPDSHVKYAVLSNFYSGGIIYYLTWQIKNKFPPDVPAVNMCLYKAIEKLREVEIA